MTPTTAIGAAIQRYKIGYHSDEWGQRSSTPSGIPDASGSWVRYEDHIAALAAGQATAAQLGAYAALPEYGINTASHAHFRVLGFTADQMRAFADATCALRASHGQAPAGATELAEADRRAGAAERKLAASKEDVARIERVRDKMKDQWGVDRRVSFDVVWAEALALKAGTKSDSVQEDAALWHWLAEYLVGTRTDLDDEIVASETVNDLRKLVEAAIKQVATQ